jgi:hypothetical protein
MRRRQHNRAAEAAQTKLSVPPVIAQVELLAAKVS